MVRAKTVAGAAGAVFLVLQLVPVYPRENPPARPEATIESHLEVSPPVKTILDRSCRDCHSDETRWPWYSGVAPVSWLIVRDVEKARSIMNFSRWSDGAGKKLELAVGMLAASCSDVTVGRMPKPDYAFLHSEAKLNKADIAAFCAWSKSEGKRLLIARRKKAAN